MKFYQAIAAVFTVATSLALPAHSAVMTYTSIEAYQAATIGNKVLDFSTQHTMHVGQYGTFGEVTFHEAFGRLFILPGGYYGDNMGGTYLNNNSGGTTVNMDFSAPVTAFALNFGTIFNWGGARSLTETFTFAGTSQTFTLPGESHSNGVSPSFVGFTSDIAFTSVSINDPTSGLAIRDVMFGNAAPADVPEPASFALLGLGLIGVAATYRRSRQH